MSTLQRTPLRLTSLSNATLHWGAIPLLPDVVDLARAGCVTGTSARNWAGYAALVDLVGYGAGEQALLTDPQTSGGLLVTCSP